MFRQGDSICERWAVKRRLGEGQFAEVYEVADSSRGGELFALKIDRKADVKTVKQEYHTLRQLQEACTQVVRVHDGAKVSGRWLMTMDLLGPNLATLLKSAYCGPLDLSAAKAIGAQLLTALEQLHREGFVHRDVKPANFVLSPPGASPTEGSWVLIDFGLARKYVEEGQVLPERPDASFRGSTTYASVPNLEQRDQGRRDDLWSWFYILAELVEGGLPWRADREAAAGPGADGQLPSQPQGGGKEQILASKLQCISDPALLFSAVPCPKAVCQISEYLATLSFESEPDYDYLRELLKTLEEDDEEEEEEKEKKEKQLPAPMDAEQAAAPAAGGQGGGGELEPAAAGPRPAVQANGRGMQEEQPVDEADGLPLELELSPEPGDSEPAVGAMDEHAGPPSKQRGAQEAVAGVAGAPGAEPAPALGNGGSTRRGGDTSAGAPGAGPSARDRERDERVRSSREERDREERQWERPRSSSRERRRSRSRELRRSKSRERRRSGSRGRRGERERDRRRSRSREGGGKRRSASGERRHSASRDRRRSPSRERERRRSSSRDKWGSRQRSRSRERQRADARRDGGRERERERPPSQQQGEQPKQQQQQEQPRSQQQVLPDWRPPRPPSSQRGQEPEHDRYRATLDYVFALRQGALSEAGQQACKAIRQLPPAEALGVVCWLIDEMATGFNSKHSREVAQCLEDVAAFASGAAKKCVVVERQ